MKIKFLVGVVIVALAVAAGIMLLPTKAVQKEAAAPVVSENKPQVSVARAAANLSPGSFLSARDIEWTAVAQSAAKDAFVQNERIGRINALFTQVQQLWTAVDSFDTPAMQPNPADGEPATLKIYPPLSH